MRALEKYRSCYCDRCHCRHCNRLKCSDSLVPCACRDCIDERSNTYKSCHKLPGCEECSVKPLTRDCYCETCHCSGCGQLKCKDNLLPCDCANCIDQVHSKYRDCHTLIPGCACSPTIRAPGPPDQNLGSIATDSDESETLATFVPFEESNAGGATVRPPNTSHSTAATVEHSAVRLEVFEPEVETVRRKAGNRPVLREAHNASRTPESDSTCIVHYCLFDNDPFVTRECGGGGGGCCSCQDCKRHCEHVFNRCKRCLKYTCHGCKLCCGSITQKCKHCLELSCSEWWRWIKTFFSKRWLWTKTVFSPWFFQYFMSLSNLMVRMVYGTNLGVLLESKRIVTKDKFGRQTMYIDEIPIVENSNSLHFMLVLKAFLWVAFTLSTGGRYILH